MPAAHANDAVDASIRAPHSVSILPTCEQTRARSVPFDTVGQPVGAQCDRTRKGEQKERGPGKSKARVLMLLLKTDYQGEDVPKDRLSGEGCTEVLLEARRVFKDMCRKL